MIKVSIYYLIGINVTIVLAYIAGFIDGRKDSEAENEKI